MSDTYLGLYRGVIEEGVDPAAHGRLRVSVPSVLGGEPRWAERSVDRPGAVAALPPGTTVWVQFEGGNSDHPVVVGCVPGPDGPRPRSWWWRSSIVVIPLGFAVR